MKFTDNFIPTYANTQSVQLKIEYPKHAPACRFLAFSHDNTQVLK